MRGIKGHLVIGFTEATDVNALFTAADELSDCLSANRGIRVKSVGTDVTAKEVFCALTLPKGGSLRLLIEQIDAACPTIAQHGSASDGRFVKSF